MSTFGSVGRERFIVSVLFFVSGFCSLLYQTIWLRQAFAKFGVITPVVSVVVSLFMFGLALGSRWGGKRIGKWVATSGKSAVFFYALAELITAVGGLAVPFLFAAGEMSLLGAGAFDSTGYLLLSALAIGLSILPWAVAMGTTFPFGMAYIRELPAQADRGSFGFLYAANVAGATAGAIIPVLVLIEFIGFQNCLFLGAALNFAVATVAYSLSAVGGKRNLSRDDVASYCEAASDSRQPLQDGSVLTERTVPLSKTILFLTGLSSMAMEVCWTRLFTTALGTVVYSFALILAVYLASTFIGSWLYRVDRKYGHERSRTLLVVNAALFSLFPVLLNDPRTAEAAPAFFALISIAPFCGALGYLTPAIIDDISRGDPEIAGHAYFINVVGGIVGPLMAAYLLLPLLGVKLSLIVLAAPLVVLALVLNASQRSMKAWLHAACALVAVAGSFLCLSWEERFPASAKPQYHRDYAATTVCCTKDNAKQLFVNGVGMTALCTSTQYMAHAPLSMLNSPGKVLIICFGMGTTYRSATKWPVDVTAVELVPGVRDSFRYFWKDAESVLQYPRGRIIVDDGRRFLKRTEDKFDLITVDPPPPVEAAGSSLLYSKEFYALVKSHLTEQGIFAQWYPCGGDQTILYSIAGSLQESFPHVAVFPSVEGYGYHFFCSNRPIAETTAEQMWERMPAAARSDLMEFLSGREAPTKELINRFFAGRTTVSKLCAESPRTVAITDDRPYNEYFLIRRSFK